MNERGSCLKIVRFFSGNSSLDGKLGQREGGSHLTVTFFTLSSGWLVPGAAFNVSIQMFYVTGTIHHANKQTHDG